MVKFRGGISEIKKTSPLTARMVPWYVASDQEYTLLMRVRVAMLVMGSPQFQTQDDSGLGDGICSIPQWQNSSDDSQYDANMLNLESLDIQPALQNILIRLRKIFRQPTMTDSPKITTILSASDLHDLTCFVIHRLLLLPTPIRMNSRPASLSESLRYAICIYMFVIHGPTYFPHTSILQSLVLQLKYRLSLALSSSVQNQLSVWLVTAGMAGSLTPSESRWFMDQALDLCATLKLQSWEDTKLCLESVLWLDIGSGDVFRQAWEGVFTSYTVTSPINLGLLPSEDENCLPHRGV
jgi:hypothetical protein